MISYIRGILAEKEEDQIVVEASSIGYEIHVPLSFLENAPPVGRRGTYLYVFAGKGGRSEPFWLPEPSGFKDV